MLTQMSHRLRTELANLPGQARLWITFVLIPLPMLVVAHVSQMPHEGGDFFGTVMVIWLLLSVFTVLGIYFLKMVFSVALWVWDGFSERTRHILGKTIRPALQGGVFVLLVAVMAVYLRYDVAVLGNSNGRYYDYVVWDRWSGEVYANSQLYNPKDKYPNRPR